MSYNVVALPNKQAMVERIQYKACLFAGRPLRKAVVSGCAARSFFLFPAAAS